jgi:hypothetical protein
MLVLSTYVEGRRLAAAPLGLRGGGWGAQIGASLYIASR